MASECPQAELQAWSFANTTRTGLTGLRVRRPRGADVVVVGDGALTGDPDLLGCDCQDQLGFFPRAESQIRK